MEQPTTPVIFKNPGLAAVLSFFWTGLGQIYNGQIGKGILFMIVYAVSWGLIFTVIFTIIGIFTTPAIFIYGMYDAYQSAQKINSDMARRAGNNQGPINTQ